VKEKFHVDMNHYNKLIYIKYKLEIKVIESFKKKSWTFKDECHVKVWNCERIANFVYSCVDFTSTKIGPLHHTFTHKHTFTFSSLATTTSNFECCQLMSLKNSGSRTKFKCNTTQNEDTTKVDPRWFGKDPKAFVKAFLLFAKKNRLTILKRNWIEAHMAKSII
jgi:hypothetical protein